MSVFFLVWIILGMYHRGQLNLSVGSSEYRDQLFFISFAQIWGRAISPAAAVSQDLPFDIQASDFFCRYSVSVQIPIPLPGIG